MSSKITDFSSAYKLTRRTENSSTRVKRRSIDWKNKRYDEVGKRRNLDKMSPLEEFSQNLTSSQNRKTHNYDGKTPSKKGSLSKQSSRKEMLLKWREERKMMKQQKSRKEKPSFKFHHVEHTDTNLYNIHTAGVETTNTSNLSKVKAPTAVSMANTKPARMTRGTKLVTSTIGKEPSHCSTKQISTSRNNTHSAGVKTTNRSKVSTSKNVKNTVQQRIKPPSPATRRVTRQMTSTKAVEKKNPIQSKLDKVKKSSTKVSKKVYDLDLTKIATHRGEMQASGIKSFAPNDYSFAAPSNLISFTFNPLSPASVAEFLCPNNEAASTSFFSADPDVGRCSTPLSKKSKKSKQPTGSSSTSSDDNVTKYSVSVDGKKFKRSTRQSSLRHADTSQKDLSVHTSKNITNEKLSSSGSSSASSDEDVTKYSVLVDGKKVKRSTRRSSVSKPDAGQPDLSVQATETITEEKLLLSGSSSASSDEDVTKYSVLVDGKKVKRSTRRSSVSKPDAGQPDLSVQATENITEEKLLLSGDEDVTKYSVLVDGKKVKRSTRQSSVSKPDAGQPDLSVQATETITEEKLLLSGSSSASSDEDVTKYSVLVDGKKVKRSTRQSSVSKPDAGQPDLSVQATENIMEEKLLLSGSSSASSDEDVTKYSVLVDGKKVKRSTRRSSVSKPDAGQPDLSVQATETITEEKLLLSGSSSASSDEYVTKYSVLVDGKKVKRSTRQSSVSKPDAGQPDLSIQATENTEKEAISPSDKGKETSDGKPIEYTVIVDGTPVKRGRKSLRSVDVGTSSVTESPNDETNKLTPGRSCRKSMIVCTPRRSNRKSMKSIATDSVLETISVPSKLTMDDDSEIISTSRLSCSETAPVKTPNHSKRKSLKIFSSSGCSSDNSNDGNDLTKDEQKGEDSSAQDSEAVDKMSSSDSEVFYERRRSSRKTRKSQINTPKNCVEKSADVATSSYGELCSNMKKVATLEDKCPDKKSSPVSVDGRQMTSSGTSVIVETIVEERKCDENVASCTPLKRSRRKSSSSIETSTETFREPVCVSTRKRRKTTACEIPPELRSPEEWVQVLASSPMVEMSRRTPKTKTPPGKLQLVPIEQLNFDDLDDDIPHITNQISQTMTSTEAPVPMDVDTNGVGTSEPTTASDGNHDVKYFRNLLVTETARLQTFCIKWNNLDTKHSGITEESEGQIRTVIGQAQLLMDQRFKQFRGLVDDCEFKRGEKETTCTDLQGFWDMIFFQVEDVHKKFEDLQKLKDKNWVIEKTAETKKKIKRKPIAGKTKPAAVSKFARFRAEMQKNKEQSKEDGAEDFKVFDAGFFKVKSPLKSPATAVTKSANKKPDDEKEARSNNNMEVKQTDPPASSNVLQIVKTPMRRSYAPCVPSPLLTDITPKHLGRRSVAGGQVIVQRKLEDEMEGKENCPQVSSVEKHSSTPEPELPSTSSSATKTFPTPRRRSLRLRSTSINENTCTSESDGSNMCSVEFQKYLQPSGVDSPVYSGRKRRSTLKMPPSSAKRRSRHRSVKFSTASPVQNDQDLHTSLPCTPYNHNSLVPRPRVQKGDMLVDMSDLADDSTEVKSCVSNTKNRPSLLFTPETPEKVTTCSSTDNLMSFSPL